MLGLFKENQIIKIIPDDVEAACNMKIIEADDKFITAQQEKSVKEPVGNIECFSVVDDGILYFKSLIEKNENNYKLKMPAAYKMLQRREYSRVLISAEVIFKGKSSNSIVSTVDISAGGMQVISDNELAMSEDYQFSLGLDKHKSINAVFTPIRQDKNNDGTYIISGKFTTMESKDRIALVQYCFKKQMENTNR